MYIRAFESALFSRYWSTLDDWNELMFCGKTAAGGVIATSTSVDRFNALSASFQWRDSLCTEGGERKNRVRKNQQIDKVKKMTKNL